MSEEYEKFAAYMDVADRMIEQASKDELAEVARVLALELSHYRAEFGGDQNEKMRDMLAAEPITNWQAGKMADGFEVLIRTLYAIQCPVEDSVANLTKH